MNKEDSPLYKLRKNLGDISLARLASELDISYSLAYNIENGVCKALSHKFLDELEKKGISRESFINEYQKFIDSFEPIDWGKAEI